MSTDHDEADQPVAGSEGLDRADRLGQELVTNASRLARSVTRASAHEVPTASLRLLSTLEEFGGATVGRLAEADRCSQPTMTAAVTALVTKGWASRRPHPEDGRASLVELTDAGRTILGAARRRNAAVIRARLAAAPGLDEADLVRTVAVLHQLLNTPDEGDR